MAVLLKLQLLWIVLLLATEALAQGAVKPERAAEVAAWLPAPPQGVGRPISDRTVWDDLARREDAEGVIARAETALQQPLPEQPDDLYLEYSRTGNRTNWQGVAGRRRGRVTDLTMAECLESRGRFLAALEDTIAALCLEKTWVMPAHDGSLANFEGKIIDIDLASSALGWNLATADYLLGDRLSAGTRQVLRDNVRRRVIDPYLAMVRAERKPNWWMLTTNNWNAVCLAGVTGAGLAQAEGVDERALLVAAAEHYSANFLKGFTADGYCSEGLGYWNYGFGHYVLLSETILQATGGRVDLLTRPEAQAPAAFGAQIEATNGVYPAFADCHINARPDASIMWFVNRKLGLGLAGWDTPPGLGGSLFEAMLHGLPNSASAAEAPSAQAAGLPPRTWFDEAGILICRPAGAEGCRMAVALKGGHNAEHHNHNDVGSYVVVLGQRTVLLDPGAETYTARTFSAKRYESKVLNSFGHPVPMVAGKLQRTGREAQAKVLATDFTDTADTLRFDLATAYDVPELQTLERTFVYSREGAGSLTVTDHVVLTQPQTFGTALITMGQYRQVPPTEVNAYDFDEAVRVQIQASAPFELHSEEIHEDTPRVPTRLGLDLTEPVTEATITVTITPLDLATEGGGAPNGGFEHGAFGWDIRDQMTRVSEEQAHAGKASLKITDASATEGSSADSARMPVAGAGKYELRGWVYPVSGDGVGLYVRYLDAAGKRLNATDERGWISPVGSIGGSTQAWTAFAFPFDVPEGTTHLQLWLHSYTNAQVEMYLDDLEVTPGTP